MHCAGESVDSAHCAGESVDSAHCTGESVDSAQEKRVASRLKI